MPLQSTSGAATYDAFGVSAVSAVTQAEAIDFNGTEDWLERASDLTGNADGKAFTFSFWLWLNDDAGQLLVNGNSRLAVNVTSSSILIYGKNTSDVNVLSLTTPAIPQNTWVHVLVSLDLTSTSSRYVYINDVQQSVTWTTYTNANVDRASTGTWYSTGPGLTTRVSNLFMDYTYRDLSVEANRRLFVTADLKPALGQAALNPILYLPMSDPTQPGLNQGTGGNFTLTGTVARSGRGPNQYNAPYSTFDGSADSLTRSTISGLADGKTFTLAFNCIANAVNERFVLWFNRDQSFGYFQVFKENLGGDSYRLKFEAFSSADTLIMSCTTGTLTLNRNHNIVISADLSDASKRHLYVDGVFRNGWSTYTNADIDFVPVSTKYYTFGEGPAGKYWSGTLGAVWFNTSYIDLSVPANLAKFVSGTGINAAPVDLGATGQLPTGTSPLIYLPMYGNNAGRNYGTGGDFTVNSGPYTGARGPNEFWGNRASFNGSTTYLARTSGVGASDGKTFSLSLWFNPTANESGDSIFNIGPDEKFLVRRDTSNQFNIFAFSPSGTALNVTTNSTIATDNTWYHVLVCVDLSNTAKRFIYINGTLFASTWSTYSSTINFNFSASNYTIGGLWNGSSYPSASVFDGGIAELYFTTTYIDFSQEAERLKFRNAFGNPVNLPQQIEALAIPNPAIYMRFPPTSFGTNSGTGGNFTVNGTITDGGQL